MIHKSQNSATLERGVLSKDPIGQIPHGINGTKLLKEQSLHNSSLPEGAQDLDYKESGLAADLLKHLNTAALSCTGSLLCVAIAGLTKISRAWSSMFQERFEQIDKARILGKAENIGDVLINCYAGTRSESSRDDFIQYHKA